LALIEDKTLHRHIVDQIMLANLKDKAQS